MTEKEIQEKADEFFDNYMQTHNLFFHQCALIDLIRKQERSVIIFERVCFCNRQMWFKICMN